jgi:hypothetical protein
MSPGFIRTNDAFNDYSVFDCDKFITADSVVYSYVHETLGHKSLLDHYFTSLKLIKLVERLTIVEAAANLSDYLPVECELRLNSVYGYPGK